jgi:dihydropteroate synthase
MGILNMTPDSFSDGGKLGHGEESGVFYIALDKALAAARQMVADGAAIIDVGGESTRPGAAPVSVQEELDRVMPVVEAITAELDVLVSVDTSTPEVMREAANHGAALINDVRALARPGALETAAATGLAVCLMHMRGEPDTMQSLTDYVDVVEEVCSFLAARVAVCEQAGIVRARLLIDPGFGFGKTVNQNYTLLRHLERLHRIGQPILVGLSRKSMIGQVVERPARERLAGSLAAASHALGQGAAIIRTHDVAATVDAVRIFHAIAPERRTIT